MYCRLRLIYMRCDWL